MLLHRILDVGRLAIIVGLLVLCPSPAVADPSESATPTEPITKHLEFFEKLAGKPVSADALQRLTKDQRDKLVEYLVARPSKAHLGYSRDVVEKWPDLVLLILVSESMDEAERKYWVSILPVMTEDQRTNLRNIIVNEREQLDNIDKHNRGAAESAEKHANTASETRRPTGNSSIGKKTPETEKSRAGHMAFFQRLAGVELSGKALAGLTDEQIEKLQSYLSSADDRQRLGYGDAIVSKWPDLLFLMLTSESMDDAERKDWVVKLPVMNAQQRADLRKILMTGRDQLNAIDRKYSAEMAKVTEQSSANSQKPRPQETEESPDDRAKRQKRASEHLEAFRTIAGTPLSEQSLSSLTEEQNGKLKSYLSTLPERERIGYSEEVVTKWSDLLLLILTSQNITERDQKEWADKLTVVNAEQRTDLRRILVEERDTWSNEVLELLNKQQTTKVIEMATERLRQLPENRSALLLRGIAYYRTNENEKAVGDFTKALTVTPTSGRQRTLHYRGKAYREQKDFEHAIADFTAAAETAKGDSLAEILLDRGGVYHQQGKYDEALADYTGALQSASKEVRAIAYANRASIYQTKRDYRSLLADRKAVIELRQDKPTDYNGSAWLMATCPEARFRDGKHAIEYARKACELTKWSDPFYFDTLAAAYAEDGQFERAVLWQDKALAHPDFSKKLSAEELAQARERASLYREQKPYREP